MIIERSDLDLELEVSRERFAAVLDGLDSAIRVADMARGKTLFANETLV